VPASNLDQAIIATSLMSRPEEDAMPERYRHLQPPVPEREPLHHKADRVVHDRDLLSLIMGLEIAIGGLVTYIGLMLILAVHKPGGGIACLVLGGLIAFAGLAPVLTPGWLKRMKVPDPFA
jgi:hypothetical protein